MLDRLKTRWKVQSNFALCMILLTFICTGSTVAWLSRSTVKWMEWTTAEHLWQIILFKVFIFLIGYQILILCFGFLFGQFRFFFEYEKKILKWMKLLKA